MPPKSKISVVSMANPYFQFKQFTVWHDRCAMKVGTDAVLLGGWVNVTGARCMLDVGCGCGLIALMAAQRNEAGRVVAVEIDAEAACQAKENVEKSPWKERIKVVNTDICDFRSEEKFDVIFSNPPYFINSLKCPDKQRSMVRHTDTLDFDTLMRCVAQLLSEDGEFSVVVPMEAVMSVKASAIQHKLYLSRETHVYSKPSAMPKRALLAFTLSLPETLVTPEVLVMYSRPNVWSDEYGKMVTDFYL